MALELEHVTTADRRTLAAWGFSEHSRASVNWGIEQLTLTLASATAGTDAPLWAYRDKLVLWSGTTRILHCWVTTTGHAASASSEAQPYILSGPGWWLDNTPFNDTSDSGYVDETAGINNQLNYLLLWAITAGAPIAVGTLALAGLSPPIGTGHTVLSAMQQVARFSPLSYGGWDHNGEVPAFNAALRADLTPVSLALFGGHVSAWDIRPRPDMQLHRVRIIYTAPNPTPGYEDDPYEYPDQAGDLDWPSGPGFLELTVPCETVNEAVAAASGTFEGTGYGSVAASLIAALSDLCREGTVLLSGSLEAFPDIRPGQALNLTGGTDGAAAWATMAAPVQQVEYSGNAAADTCLITLGLPQQLGVQDYLELYRLASGGANGAGRPYPPLPPTPPTPTPGTLQDLNVGGNPAGGLDGDLVVEKMIVSGDLLGVPEYVASSPPKYYRTATGSGSMQYTLNGGDLQLETVSGSAHIADDGNYSSYIQRNCSHDGVPMATIDTPRAWQGSPYGNAHVANPFFYTGPTTGYQRYTRSISSREPYPYHTGGIFPAAEDDAVYSFEPYTTVTSGQINESLSDEDTEQALIARYTAGLLWGNWGVDATAAYPARTAGRHVDFEKLRWRITRTVSTSTFIGYDAEMKPVYEVTTEIRQEIGGLRPGWWYTLKVIVQRGVTGGTWADFETKEYLLKADLTGVAATPDWIEIVPERGYYYRIKPGGLSVVP